MSELRMTDLLKALDPGKGVELWYGGASTVGALRGVKLAQAAWRPAPGRHNIWELVLHVAYWKYAVRRKLTGEPRGTFPRRPANWPIVPEDAGAREWAQDRALLQEEHLKLVAAIEAIGDVDLDAKPADRGKWTYSDLLYGILMHDVYHTGQIQILKRICPQR